ncbi:MAG: hypothetical protein GXP31_03740 [Kiritimatiellaeota bacterium]|nr:hypothetical protein [Kiritimatiellota bacterium]
MVSAPTVKVDAVADIPAVLRDDGHGDVLPKPSLIDLTLQNNKLPAVFIVAVQDRGGGSGGRIRVPS